MAFKGEPQWGVVGDTFPVGCAWGDSIVYRDTTFNKNPDSYDPRFKYLNFLFNFFDCYLLYIFYII